VSDVDEFCPSPAARVEVRDVEGGRFGVGDRVTVRATPTGPTENPRTPPYAVGRSGTVLAVHGVVLNPMDHHRAYAPMYSGRFDGRDLFGPAATHTVVAEVHDEFLDPA
jgi:hypothetical protein